MTTSPGALPALDRCATCGEASGAPSRCPHCGSSLAVDVLLDPAPADARLLFKAARAAAAAAIPGLDFATARAALERPGAPLATALPRDRARALLSALAAAGFAASARAAVGRPAAPRRRAALVAAAAGALVVAAVAAALALRAGPPATVAGTSPPTPPAPAPSAAPAPEAAAPAAPAVSTQELGRRARPALAALSCRGKIGSGFFVAPDLLLTNAHVTCGKDAKLEVKLDDGRRLLGRVRALDEWLDWAVVEVTGAGVAAPLALGDSTRLEAGDPVVLVGSPLGLDATLHAGRVSFAARNLEGVVHVQVNADVNPGNSGGPLLDGEGRAVAIVTLRAEGASGVGFALPVEYARAALELPAADDAARERWDAAVARAADEDREEATRLVARLERPLLLAVDAVGPRLGLLVMHRWPAGPGPVPLAVEIRDGEQLVCELQGEVQEWAALAEQLEQLAKHEGARRRVRWMVRRGISKDAYAGAALVDPARCPSPPPASARVSLRGAPDEAPPFPAEALAEGARRAAEQEATAVQLAAQGAAEAEAAWRQAFREARERIAKLEARRRELRAAEDAGLVVEARRELPGVERELAEARDDLDDLERRASHAAVPREWRR